MCGRFARATELERMRRLLGFEKADEAALVELHPRYNIAPTQAVAAVRLEDGHRTLVALRWGLIPSWSKDPKLAHSLINARSETVAEKPAFRSAFKSRRCLIPATCFYEWQATGGKYKQPYAIGMRDGAPFAFAGLWERWKGEDVEAEVIQSCTILTTEANAVMRPVHDRMPVILPPEHFTAWLDPHTPVADLHPLLRPYPAEEMEAVAVSRYVSNPRNEGPRCLSP
jgi:putative SOS response-associated peptidase YedK